MTTVLAAVDADDAAVPTLQGAELLAGVYGADVEVVHVTTPGSPDRPLPMAFADVVVRTLEGEVVPVLVNELAREDVVGCVVGTRSAGDTERPAGSVALGVIAQVDKPVALVPPDWDVPGASRLRILVPLDGTEDADLTVRAVIARVAHAGLDVVVLHVFDPSSVPPFLDRPEHDLPAWSHEFLQRHCEEGASSMVWRTGRPGVGIVDAIATEDIHAVVLGWKGGLEPGRAAVVRDVLARASVPVLMVPRAQAERTLAELSLADRRA